MFNSGAEYGTGDKIQKLLPACEMCNYNKQIFNSWDHDVNKRLKKIKCFIKQRKHLRRVHSQGALPGLPGVQSWL